MLHLDSSVNLIVMREGNNSEDLTKPNLQFCLKWRFWHM